MIQHFELAQCRALLFETSMHILPLPLFVRMYENLLRKGEKFVILYTKYKP